jgi:hypothetical protein
MFSLNCYSLFFTISGTQFYQHYVTSDQGYQNPQNPATTSHQGYRNTPTSYQVFFFSYLISTKLLPCSSSLSLATILGKLKNLLSRLAFIMKKFLCRKNLAAE